jgi:hypothetical protein
LNVVSAHYEARWGSPSRRWNFERGSSGIEIFKWDHDQTAEGLTVYATVLRRAEEMLAVDDAQYPEFFVQLLPEEDAIAPAMALLGTFAVRKHVAVGHGHSTTHPEPLWPTTEMNSFLILRQISEAAVPQLLLDDAGRHIDFFRAVPVYDSEVRFKAARGVDALIDLWNERSIAFWDPRRSDWVSRGGG